MAGKGLSCVLGCAVWLSCVAGAGAWDAEVSYPSDGPVIFVDKEEGVLSLWDGTTLRRWISTSGQVFGDKQSRDDKKTPEGVYFVTAKRDRGLDFEEYGGIAYPLDYPNPVDRSRGKTGHGIWVHSKGRAIRPNETRGCVALDLKNIAVLGPYLQKGMPVVIGQRARATDKANQKLEAVRDKTMAWLASEDGKAVLDTMPGAASTGGVQVLEGPGYWVAWPSRTPAALGALRIYWEQSSEGALRLIGTSWTPR